MTTRQQIEYLVKELNIATGNDPVVWKREAQRNVASIGSFTIDHNIGGYQLEQIENESGGVSCPFGYERYSGPGFIRFLRSTLTAINIGKGRQK